MQKNANLKDKIRTLCKIKRAKSNISIQIIVHHRNKLMKCTEKN